MNQKPFNAAPFISSIRESAIRLAISAAVEVVGTVRLRVIRSARVAQSIAVVGAVKARMITNAKIAQAIEVVGAFFSGTRRKVHSAFLGDVQVTGLFSPRIRTRGKIVGAVEMSGTVAARVLHLVRFDALVQAVSVVGRVSGNDLATGPADESRSISVPAQSRRIVVPGSARSSGVA